MNMKKDGAPPPAATEVDEERSGVLHRRSRSPGVYIFREPLIYMPLLLAALVAWFAPPNSLDRLPWVAIASDSLKTVFPSMAAYVQRSQFPQVTELYFLLAVVSAPLHVPYVYRDYRARLPFHRDEWIASDAGKLRFVISALILLPGLAIFAVVLNSGYELSWMPFGSSRLALGLFGWIVAGHGAVILATTSVLWIWGMVNGDLTNPDARRH